MPFSDVASGYIETTEEKIQLQACNEISRVVTKLAGDASWTTEELKAYAERIGVAIAAGHAAFDKARAS